jgi:predicted transcriptional regulator
MGMKARMKGARQMRRELDFFKMVNEVFKCRNFGAQETYRYLLESGGGKTLGEMARSRGVSARTIRRHLESVVAAGVASREENGSITLKIPTQSLFLGLIAEDRRKIHGWGVK